MRRDRYPLYFDGAYYLRRVCTHEDIAARFDGFDPFGFVTPGHARAFKEKRLLLQPLRVCQGDGSVIEEPEQVQVPDGFDEL